jgi:hypothetical protein
MEAHMTYKTLKSVVLAGSIAVSLTPLAAGQDYTRSAKAIYTTEAIPLHGAHAVDFHHPGIDESHGPVTFLGLHVTPVDPIVSAQLGIPSGMGLAIQYVVPESPADKAGLRKHDILRKLEDQILIHPQQLQVLVRHRTEGDKVTLTLLRAGEELSITAELDSRDPLKVMRRQYEFRRSHGDEDGDSPSWIGRDSSEDQGNSSSPARREHHGVPMPGNYLRDMGVIFNRDGLDPVRHMRVLVGSGLASPAGTLPDIEHREIDHHTLIRLRDRQVVYTDESGDLILTSRDGRLHLKALDTDGTTIYDGPYNTEEERGAVDPDIREKLERLEANRNLDVNMAPEKIRFMSSARAGAI